MTAPESKPLVAVGRPPDPVDTAADNASEADDATSTVPATAVRAPVLMRSPIFFTWSSVKHSNLRSGLRHHQSNEAGRTREHDCGTPRA